jgi:hypothetical protein
MAGWTGRGQSRGHPGRYRSRLRILTPEETTLATQRSGKRYLETGQGTGAFQKKKRSSVYSLGQSEWLVGFARVCSFGRRQV